MSTKSVPFDFPGFKRPRELRFDYNAIAELENTLGMTPNQIFQQRAGLFTIRGLLWAGLRHEQPNLTQEAVGNMIQSFISEHGGELDQLSTKVGEAIKASGLFKEATEDGDEDDGDQGNEEQDAPPAPTSVQ